MNPSYTKVRAREERDRLVESYLPLVHHIVGRIGSALPPPLDKEDLFGAGVLGLMHAAETYDPSKGASFKTFAYSAVRGAVLDEIRKQDPLTRSLRERLKDLERSTARLCHELGRQPTREELARDLGVQPADLDRIWSAMHLCHVLSLSEGSGEEDGLGLDPPDSRPGPEDRAARAESVQRLAKAIGRLPEQQRQVVILYHYEGLKLKEIGALLGVTESRVSQILSKALTVLKITMEDEDRKP